MRYCNPRKPDFLIKESKVKSKNKTCHIGTDRAAVKISGTVSHQGSHQTLVCLVIWLSSSSWTYYIFPDIFLYVSCTVNRLNWSTERKSPRDRHDLLHTWVVMILTVITLTVITLTSSSPSPKRNSPPFLSQLLTSHSLVCLLTLFTIFMNQLHGRNQAANLWHRTQSELTWLFLCHHVLPFTYLTVLQPDKLQRLEPRWRLRSE